jgi:hypothetical protein
MVFTATSIFVTNNYVSTKDAVSEEAYSDLVVPYRWLLHLVVQAFAVCTDY